MLEVLDYRDCLKIADAYKTTGQTRIYLYDGSVFPWEHVSKIEPGGSHRLDIATSVRFTALIDGLEFHWTFDIEPPDANGKGHYEIAAGACRDVLAKIPPEAAAELRKYFADCAGKVEARGQEFQRIADRQRRDADVLHALAAGV